MARVHVNEDGAITLPEDVLTSTGWTEGMELEVESHGGVVIIRPARPFPPKTVDEVFGCLKWQGPPVTIEEMDEGVKRAAREMWRDFEKQPD